MNRSVERLTGMAWMVLLALVVLLGITLVNLGGAVPALKPLGNATRAPTDWPSAAQVEPWFDRAGLVRLLSPPTNSVNPFFTLHFQPPPPPTTRPAEVTFLGYIQSGTNLPRAWLRIDKATKVMAPGDVVVADHRVARIARRTLVLTNAGGATNVLEFNIKRVLTVPIQ